MDKKNASKAVRKYVIASIMLKNLGKFNIIPALGDNVILDTDLTANDVKLPKDCEIKINSTDTYRKGKRIAAFWGKVKSYMSVDDVEKFIEDFKRLNDDNLVCAKKAKRFLINTDMFLSDIKFPEGFSYVIVYNPSEKDNSYQCQIIKDGNSVFPGVLNCKAKENDKVIFPGVLVDTEKSNENDKKNVL